MIIVTGCDNTGKTTLVKHLSDKFNIPIHPRYAPLPPTDSKDWVRWIRKRFEDNDMQLHDRMFIDELVYGPVMRGGYLCSNEEMTTLCDVLLLRQPLYIYTEVPLSNILNKFDEREQYPTGTDLVEVLRKFDQVNSTWPVKFLSNQLVFDYTEDPDYAKIDTKISKYLKEGTL